METKYRRIYRMLKNFEHSAAKAIEIILDAKRGDKIAMQWIRMIHRARQTGT